jgi:hypothetical protein
MSGVVERHLDLASSIDEESLGVVMSCHGGKLLSEPVCLTATGFGDNGGHRSSLSRRTENRATGERAELGCGVLTTKMTHGRVALAAKARHIEGTPHFVGRPRNDFD